MKTNNEWLWWKHGIVYHIYPQSYKDTNNDGVGDLEGIIRQLDYLSNLGIDAIWLSPIYQSPLIDGGYDISDYFSIHPRYGTMDDFKRLLHTAHQKGIRIIMDLVLNHTSDKHPWFQESRSSKENPRRDWYIWQPPTAKGKRPNNWRTNFNQPAWRYDTATKEYYYHSFFKEQPDLNWRNPAVREAMFDIVRFWLRMGVDGFRLDVINLIFKQAEWKNNPLFGSLYINKVYNRNQPEVYEVLKEFRLLLNQYPDVTSVGEIYMPPPGNSKIAASFAGNGKDMLHLVFDFSLMFAQWGATSYRSVIRNYYNALPNDGWPCFVISNHDLGRSAGRWPFGFNKHAKTRIQAVLLLTLRGTPFIYYGDEIGMENARIRKSQIQDMYGKLLYPFYKGRDRGRTPMQWNAGRYAGFSETAPWLPVHKNYRKTNVQTESENEHSLLHLYKQLIRLRKEKQVLQHGEILFLQTDSKKVLVYKRFNEKERIVVVLNFSFRQQTIAIPEAEGCKVLLSSPGNIFRTKNNRAVIAPFGHLILELVMIKK